MLKVAFVSSPGLLSQHLGGACAASLQRNSAQSPHDFLSDAVPVDASRLPVPLHHQAVQRSHENTRLRLYHNIRAKLSGGDPCLQQLAERGDTARLSLSGSLRQDGNVLAQIPALHEHAAGIGFCLHLPTDWRK